MTLMKKILSIAIFAIILGMTAPAAVQAGEVNVYIGGRQIVFPDQSPVIIDGQLLIPVRALFETLNRSGQIAFKMI